MPRLTRAASATIAATKGPECTEESAEPKISEPPGSSKTKEKVEECETSIPQEQKNSAESGKSIPSNESNEINVEKSASVDSSPPVNTQSKEGPTTNSKATTNNIQTKTSKQAPNSYIPPNERRLGLHAHAINEPHPMIESANLMDFELQKFVGLTIATSAHNPSFSGEYLAEVSLLAGQFMDTFSSSLRKLTDIQRHNLPGIADLQLCMENLDLSPKDLYQEYLRTQALPTSVRQQAARLREEVENMLKEYHAEKYDLLKDDPSLVFYTNEQYEIAALVPQQNNTRDYIPEYLPELPPDFTYKLTSSFMETMTELKKIKMKLFEESRLNEASLYKLIDDDEKRWLEELNEQLGSASDEESQNEDIMSSSGGYDSEVETPEPLPASKPNLNMPFKESTSDMATGPVSDNGRMIFKDSALSSDDAEDKMDVDTEKPAEKHVLLAPDVKENAQESAEVMKAEPKEVISETAETIDLTGPSADSNEQTESIQKSTEKETAKSSKNENYFDIVAYAEKRRLALERPLKEIKRQQDLRSKNYYLHAEKRFSSYAVGPPTPMDLAYVDGILKKSFKNVIRATRRAEKRKQEKLAHLAAERERQEKESQQLHGTLEFAFNDATNFLDESDDNMDDSNAFDFGDALPVTTATATATETAIAPVAATEQITVRTATTPSATTVTPSAPGSASLTPAPMVSTSPPANQVSGKMPMKSISTEKPDDMDLDGDNFDGMLEELELFEGSSWPEPEIGKAVSENAAEQESEDDELEDL